MDPVDAGMMVYAPLMEEIAKHAPDKRTLIGIARMIDAFAASLQLKAVERGLDGPPDVMRQFIKDKLQSIGFYPMSDEAALFQKGEPAPPPLCLCIRDEDGECQSCKGRVAAFATEFAEVQRMYLGRIEKIEGLSERAPCDSCKIKYADGGFADVFTSVGDAIPADHINIVMTMYGTFRQMLSAVGVTATPMLDKAWADLKAKKGVE